jgi:peptidoglycan hydrolase CwlO-like protein
MDILKKQLVYIHVIVVILCFKMEIILLNAFELVEFLVLGAIAIELLTLYRHIRFDRRMDEHIKDTNLRLEKTDKIIEILDEHILRFDEHIKKADKQMIEMTKFMKKLEKEIGIYAENMNRLDDHIWESYEQLRSL